jgi:hypothetical protein
MTHEYMKSEEVAAIREFYQTLPLDLDSSVLAVRRDFLRLIGDWQVLMEENRRLREELELSQAEMAVWKGWRDKLQARTIELFEREKKLVETLKWIAYDAPPRWADRAHNTLKELGIE